MKPISLILFVTLLGAAGGALAFDRGNCPERGSCPVPPVPPTPPTPPMPPMPPAPPPMPVVPEAAHDACAGKAVGTKMTYRPRRGESMRGTCEKDNKGMYFDVQEIRVVN